MRRFQALAAFGIAVALSPSASADVITDWNGTAIEAGRSFANPNPASYAVVISHLAAYDAVNAIHPTGEPYLSDSVALGATGAESLDAAAAQAFHDVLVQLVPAKKAELDTALELSLAAVPAGDPKTQGSAVGAAAAAAILDARKTDVTSPAPAPAPFVGEDALGKWRPTPRDPFLSKQPPEPVVNPPLAGNTPWWVELEPFAIPSNDVYDPGPPPTLTSARYAQDFLEVKQYGAKTSAVRTGDQTAIARFWAQQTHVPFNAIARTLSLREQLSVDDNARLFALLNLALADSRIAVWRAKYQYLAWRPITAINSQEDDGNPDTVPVAPAADAFTPPTWVPLLETPNHPEYPSGHSGTGAAGAGVLAYWFGDDVPFTIGSDSYLGYTRSFTSLSQAKQENANSRIYAGIHFRFANEAGIVLGDKIAKHVTETYLKKYDVPEPGAGGAGGAEGGGGGETSGTAGAPNEAGAGPTPNGGTTGAGGTGGTTAGSTSGGSTPSDAGEPSTEGGAEPGSDPASGGKAGGSSSGESNDDSGCSVGGGGTGSGAPFLLAALSLVGLLRRRRARP
jgi:MYXO-CTERM domain-containing protein